MNEHLREKRFTDDLTAIISDTPHQGAMSNQYMLHFEPDQRKEDLLLAPRRREWRVDKSLITDQDIGKCTFLAIIRTVRYGLLDLHPEDEATEETTTPGCLVVFDFRFAPHKARFANARIEISFEPANEDDDEAPIVQAVGPESLMGEKSNSEVNTVLRGGFSLGVPASSSTQFNMGVSLGAERERRRVVPAYMKIQGVGVKTSRVVFTLDENDQLEDGIPGEFVGAVILKHKGPFVAELKVEADIVWESVMRSVLARLGFGKKLKDIDPITFDGRSELGDLPKDLVVNQTNFRNWDEVHR